MNNCYMCFGWGAVHPVNTGNQLDNGKPLVVWLASMGTHANGSVECPACKGSGKQERPETDYPGSIIKYKDAF